MEYSIIQFPWNLCLPKRWTNCSKLYYHALVKMIWGILIIWCMITIYFSLSHPCFYACQELLLYSWNPGETDDFLIDCCHLNLDSRFRFDIEVICNLFSSAVCTAHSLIVHWLIISHTFDISIPKWRYFLATEKQL